MSLLLQSWNIFVNQSIIADLAEFLHSYKVTAGNTGQGTQISLRKGKVQLRNKFDFVCSWDHEHFGSHAK